MSNKEVVKALKSTLKIYAGITSAAYFSSTCAKIENDMCKPKTVKEFFAKFGYVGDWNNFEKKPA